MYGKVTDYHYWPISFKNMKWGCASYTVFLFTLSYMTWTGQMIAAFTLAFWLFIFAWILWKMEQVRLLKRQIVADRVLAELMNQE